MSCKTTTRSTFWSYLSRYEHFERIVEIGTGDGDNTRIIAEIFSCPMYTHDIANLGFFSVNNIRYIKTDVFVAPEHVGYLISAPGRCLVLCDGGDKKREVRLFYNYLKEFDVIMAHDYLSEIFDEDFDGLDLGDFHPEWLKTHGWTGGIRLCQRKIKVEGPKER